MRTRAGKAHKSNTLSFLVDAESVANDPDLPYLLSFNEVDGISVEQNVVIVERPGQDSKAIIGAAGNTHVWLAPLNQFNRFAQEIGSRPGCQVSTGTVQRALAYSFLAERLEVDAVVSTARPAFSQNDRGLLDLDSLVTVKEALAMIGAHVRQQERVPLGGSPLLTQERTEVYPLTARVIILRGQDWWASCVATVASPGDDLLSHAGAVFKRAGQALRARDAVHETMRVRVGRGAILDALYHFDVVLTSGVGGLDALARVANEIFRISSPVQEVGWQRKKWRKELEHVVPQVAGVIAPETELGAALRVITTLRNSIHSIPLDEYLYVQPTPGEDLVEHRVMIARDLAAQIRDVSGPLVAATGFTTGLDLLLDTPRDNSTRGGRCGLSRIPGIAAGDLLLEPVRASYRAHAAPEFWEKVRVEGSSRC